MLKRLRTILSFAMIVLFATSPAFAQSEGDYIRSQIALKLVQENLQLNDRDLKLSVTGQSDSVQRNRVYRSITLNHPATGTTRLLISAPWGFETANTRFPVVFISAGFLTGGNAIRLLPDDRKDLIIVGYDYPATEDQIKKDPSILAKAIRIIPGQLALTLEWLKDQPWANPYSIHPVGVSLGTLFLPIALKLAEARGFIPRTTSLLYGGAHIQPVLEQLLGDSVAPQTAKPMIDLLVNLTAPYDPKMFLPSLRGPFLHISGAEDDVFPRSTSVMQFVLLPQPKETHEIPGPHIDPSRPEIVNQTAEIFLQFLNRNL